MAVHSHRTGAGWVLGAVVSWGTLAQRFSFVFFLVLAGGLLALGRTQPLLVEHVRASLVDGMAPVLDAVARPMSAARSLAHDLASYASLRAENERLRGENERLVRWQSRALSLENENKDLRALLHYKVEPQLAYISARVIADAGGPFVRSLVVTAGRVDGVRQGMAAMTGEGLVGRVIEVGDWSSRVLLVTDLSSRIPVTVSGSGDHAILAGDNSPQPRLLYMPQDASARVGAEVMTSGHGGVFPPNLPVGVITKMGHGGAEVAPLASLERLNQVRLVDFNLAGGAFNPIAAKLQADAVRP